MADLIDRRPRQRTQSRSSAAISAFSIAISSLYATDGRIFSLGNPAVSAFPERKCALQVFARTCTVKQPHPDPLATKGFFQKCQNRATRYADAARAADPPLVLHRWLATPQSASAHDRAVVSAMPGSRPRHAGNFADYVVPHRGDFTAFRLGSSAACAPTATTGSTAPIARVPRSARMARLPTQTIRGTGQAKAVYSLTRRSQRRSLWAIRIGCPKNDTPLSSIRRIIQRRGHSCADPTAKPSFGSRLTLSDRFYTPTLTRPDNERAGCPVRP